MGDRILIVDDDPSVCKVLKTALCAAGYTCEEADNGVVALEKLPSADYTLVLSDIRMPRMDGLALLGAIRAEYEDIAVIMITGNADVKDAVASLKAGAYDYVTKPFDVRTLPHTVSRALERRQLLLQNREYQRGLERLVEQQTSELMITYQQTLKALGSALDSRDSETHDHAERVVQYTVAVASEMEVYGRNLRDIEWGAILHDVGKIGVPDAILRKPDKLTAEEWSIMKAHPEFGFRMLQNIPFLNGALPVVRHHHERWDGSGYPSALKNDEIPIGARIFAVADAFDAITSERPYKAPLPGGAAKAEILRCAGVHFDPQAVEAFARVFESSNSPFLRFTD